MFASRNVGMLKPDNNNEHFIDRDGHAFWFVLEYHRKGRLPPLPPASPGCCSSFLSAQAVMDELEYFLIPIPSTEQRAFVYSEDVVACNVDAVVNMLLDVINHARAIYVSWVHINFPASEIASFSTSPNIPEIYNRARPFALYGNLLYQFREEIERYLKNRVSGLKFILEIRGGKVQLNLYIEEFLPKENVIAKTVLNDV
jgi:hypothetical protein